MEKGPAKAREEGVQEMWNQMMPHLVDNLWRDCRNPNGIQFDGRRHDIDLVILAKDVVSILYLDSSIELTDTISSDAERREVVLQLLDRFDATFRGQPRRQVCWGLGMDATDVLFVKYQNDTSLSYSVSSNCSLSGLGWDLFLGFIKAPVVSRGYVGVVLPRLFGVSPQSRLGHNVYQLCDQTACKVASKEAIQREHRMLKYVYGRADFLIPTPRDETEYKTGCTEHPFGFRMSCLDVSSVRSEDELLELTSNIFWGLGVLHAIGVVHRDVKPSNILSGHRFEDKSSYLLCDFGMAIFWNQNESIQSAGTEAFSSIPGEFQATNQNMFLRDLESLYWTVLCWWLQIIKGRETPGAYVDTRQAD
ncbi:protein kinase domain-containing protein, partial [Marinobacter sp.]